MKNLVYLILFMVLTFGSVACTKVPSGNVGVKVYLLGGNKGVDTEELGVGRYWIGWNEELYIFPTYTQNYVWSADSREGSPDDESITFQTKEGLSVNADIGIAYHIDPNMVNDIFQKYRKGVEEITDIYLRNIVRDAFVVASSNKPVEFVYGEGKAALRDEVESIVKSKVEPIGIIIEQISFVGDLRLPGSVITALNAKIEATQTAQRVENQVREAEAEARKKIAAAQGEAESIKLVALAQAEANKILSNSITATLVEYKRIEKWNGIMPTYMAGTMPSPMLSIKE
jgi:regulator of protease activity HflC (stomatin/prohibitin superfamily)